MTRKRQCPRRLGVGQREEGIALIVSLLVTMVCVILVAAGAQLAIHSIQRSGLSRNRSASLHAAEAGIEAVLASLSASSACPPPPPPSGPVEVQLPDQNLPSESYTILAPVSCTVGGNAVVASVGYVPNVAHAVATTTIVAHINRGQGAPVSGFGSAGTQACTTPAQCGYVFPDAVFAGCVTTTCSGTAGTISASAANPLSAYGTGGTVPNIVGDGAINITGSQLDGLVHGWSTVGLSVPAVGGEVIGNGVTLSGATVQGAATVLGTPGLGVLSSGSVSLTNTSVNGNVTYCCSTANYTADTSSAVRGTVSLGSNTLPQTMRQMPTFSESSADMQTILGVGPPSSTACPSTSGSYFDISTAGVAVACTYSPATINGTVLLVARSLLGGVLTVNVPPTTTGGQLYVIFSGAGAADTLNIVGSNSTLPVFAFSDGPLNVKGGVTGQMLGGSVTTSGPTTLTFSPPSIPAPDFAFSTSQTAPGSLGYAATIAFEYQCPGRRAC